MKRKKILLIEDEADFANPVKIILERNKFDVTIAKDGEIGLEMASSEKQDLIILDIFLPKINGFDVLKKLKSDHSTNQIPVVILSNLNREEDIKKGSNLGAINHFVKIQTSAREIIDAVRKILDK